MIFDKTPANVFRLAGAIALCVCFLARGEEARFSVSAPAAGSDNGSLIHTLEHRAVVEWLQRYLGQRYDVFASRITPDFSRRYILDYSVSHAGEPSVVTLTGHLDADGLKRWTRINEIKKGEKQIKVAFLLSSSIPGANYSPATTAAALSDSEIAQNVFDQATNAFRKLNGKLSPLATQGFGLSQPPKNRTESSMLQQVATAEGFNSALWVQIVPLKGSNGFRIDLYLYSLLGSPRVVIGRSEDLPLSSNDLYRKDKLLPALKAVFDPFRSDAESELSEGTLFSLPHRLIVEGIDSYPSFTQIEAGLSKQDYIDQESLKRSSSHEGEFEILSSMKNEEIYKKLAQTDLGGFKLKPVRIDSQGFVMRYFK